MGEGEKEEVRGGNGRREGRGERGEGGESEERRRGKGKGIVGGGGEYERADGGAGGDGGDGAGADVAGDAAAGGEEGEDVGGLGGGGLRVGEGGLVVVCRGRGKGGRIPLWCFGFGYGCYVLRVGGIDDEADGVRRFANGERSETMDP